MNRIFKYKLQAEGRQLIQVPTGAKFLSVLMQDGFPVIYALFDAELQGVETRIIRTVSTGEDFNAAGCEFVGTFLADGWFVGHVFEQVEQGQSDVISERYKPDFAELRADQSRDTAVLA